jgi:phosphonate transport system substrate-binding protein
VAVLAMAIQPIADPAAAAGAPSPLLARAVLPADMLAGVSRKDAEIALAAWAKELGRAAATPMQTQTSILDDADAVSSTVLRGDVDVFGLATLDYLRLRETLPADPVLVGERGRGPEDEYLIVVRRDSGLATLKDLAAKRLVCQTGAAGTLSRMWLDVALHRQSLPDASRFLGEVRSVGRPSQAVLPVFFRQADAAVVTQTAYATLQELNPQLGRDLVVLSRSPKLLFSLMLFKINRVIPFDPANLDGVSWLVQEHATQRNGRRP